MTAKKKVPARRFVCRLPEAVALAVEQSIDSRAVPISRNSYIVEAIVEKLAREKKHSPLKH